MIINSIPLVKLDLRLAPEKLIVDLINRDNGTDFKSDQLVFGLPILLTTGKYNSKVVVSASPGSHFTGSAALRYNRIDMQSVIGTKSNVFEITNETKISDLVPAIDSRFLLRLTPADYVDTPLPTFTEFDAVKDIEVVAADTSLVFVSKMMLKIKLANIIELSTIITNVMLSGLVYRKPIPALPELIDGPYYSGIV